ncbi:MAG: bifunctional sulfate adenylyltransferase/adenylylsulfate kinase [Proteobacteria bacterium]|nr:bifunctional sulfate adenylyltransferase/adenylylsulfate kinase [Pseudomonadota bacterium]
MGDFKEAHGGALMDLYLGGAAAEDEKTKARDYPSWDLSERHLCDVEMLLNGAFSPLNGFLSRADYDGVVENMRLSSDLIWPMPVMLDVTMEFALTTSEGETIALRDHEGILIASLKIQEIWEPDKSREAIGVFGTDDTAHPGVDYLMNRTHPVYLSGALVGVERPRHYDFKLLRNSPSELRERFRKLGWRKIVAFQTRNPMHRAHQELTFRAARDQEANLLIHPVVGLTKPGDVDHYTRVRCYENILRHYPDQTTTLSLLNLAMRMAGPREAVWHGIIRKNFGCTHFIVGRDHAGPGNRPDGTPFYGPYAAQELFSEHQSELDISMVPFQEMVYVENRAQYLPVNETTDDMTIRSISGTEFRRRLQEGLEIPEWFSFPDVIDELRKRYPPRHEQGVALFFTGLSGAGKSTIANALLVKLMENGDRRVTLLDGDVVRKNLSSELGFSKEHRDLNILRIGYVAAEIVKNGGIAICAPIAPYAATRRRVRSMIEEVGGFIEIHVSTSLATCEQRDRKGLYAKARAGLVKGVTGIDDPYEKPENPEMLIDTESISAELAAQRVLVKMESMGFIR